MEAEKKVQQANAELVPVYPPYHVLPYEETEALNLLSYVNVLLRRRRLMVAMVSVTVMSAYVFSKLQTKSYEATATFLVAEKSSGAVMGEQSGSPFFQNPVDYYKKITLSSPILDPLLKETFPHPQSGKPASLLEIWKVEEESEEEKLFSGRTALAGNLKLTSERNFPNIITLKVTSESPQLAAAVANKAIELLGRYDLQLKTANAQERIRFIETQIADTNAKLKDAEEALQKFQERNRVLSTPLLTIEKERLDREVKLHSEIFITLKKELEIARIAERKEASVISIIDKATPPRSPVAPRTRLNVMLAGVVGLMLAVGMAFVLEYVSNFDAENDEENREFLRRWQETKADLRKVLLLGLGTRKLDAAPSSAAAQSTQYPVQSAKYP